MKTSYGFIDFGSGDESLLYSHALTSLPAGATVGGAGSANVNFTDKGVQLSNTGYLRLADMGGAQSALLDNGGQISFEVESQFFNPTYQGAGNENIVLTTDNGTNNLAVMKPNGSSNVFTAYNAAGLSQKAVLSSESAAKGTHSIIHISWTNKEVAVYKDYVLVMKNTWTAKPVGLFTQLYIGGRNTGAYQSIAVYRVRNFAISSRPVRLPVRKALNDVIVLGHSYSVNGDYPNADFATIGLSTSASFQDSGFIPQAQRYLACRGVHLGTGRMTCYGQNGALVSGMSAQLSTAIAAGHRHPDVAVLVCGINNILGLVGGLTSQFLTDYQTVINALITQNPNISILVCNIPNPTGYTGASWTAADVDTGNAYIKQLETLYPANCRVVDWFATMGGWAGKSTTDFLADLLHLSKSGNDKAALSLGQALYSML